MATARSTVTASVIRLGSFERNGTGTRRKFRQVRVLVADRQVPPALTHWLVAKLDALPDRFHL
jgi:hypothetical protein